MVDESGTSDSGDRWAYSYELEPALSPERLGAVKSLLEREHEAPGNGEGTWASRLVLEERVTHILVVSDTPRQDLEVNQRLERKLRDLKAGFSVTAPLVVTDDSGPTPGPAD